jgi:uncharacterized membrane protein required for colicin V production
LLLAFDSIPQLSLGTTVLIIFMICAGFVLLRGMMRMLVGTIVLGLSAWIAFRVWQMAPAWSIEWIGKPLALITNGLPLVAFLVSVFVIRLIANAIAQPFRKPTDESLPRSFANAVFRLLLAMIPTSLICAIGVMLVQHTAAVADVRASTEKKSPASFSQRLKSSIEAAIPENWLQILDPLTDSSRLSLAKLIAAQSASPLKPVINPHTGKPIPRAIIVDDSALQQLAREGKFDTLLRHPLLTKALSDPKIQKLLGDLKL